MPQYNPDFILPTLARKPDTAHPYDEEFDEGTTLDAAWSAYRVNPGGSSPGTHSPISTSSNICSRYNDSTEFRVNVNPTQRPSYLRVQPIQGDGSNMLTRAVTVPDNFLIYMRFNWTQDHDVSNSEGNILMALSEAATGDNNDIRIMLNQAAGNYQSVVVFQKRAGGSPDSKINTDRNSEGSAIEYLAIHKVGTTYYGWAGTESNWVLVGSFTSVSYNMAHLHIKFKDQLGDPTRVYGIDFIRFLETDKFPF